MADIRVTVRPNVPDEQGPWSKYVPDSAPATTPAPQAGPWSIAPEMSTVEDVAWTVPSGLARGAAYVSGTAGDIQKGVHWLGQQAERLVRGETSDEYQQRVTRGENFAPSRDQLPQGMRWRSGDDYVNEIEQVTGPLHQPQTRVGEYVNTAAEFIPGAMIGPGGWVRNALSFGVAPAAASEFVHGYTKGSNIDPFAKGTAAFATGLVAAMSRRPNAAQNVVRDALGDVTPQQLQAADALMQQSLARGISLSWPEAIQQVTNGATNLADLQRVIEGSGAMSQFYSMRPDQLRAAARAQFDNIAPVGPNPSNIGPQAVETAKSVANDVRGAINRATEPMYPGDFIVPGRHMARVRNLPGYDEATAAIRNDPQLNRYVADMPENSVAYLNEMKKYFGQQAENAAGPLNAQKNQQRAAGYGQDERTVRQVAIDATAGQTGPYAQALETQQRLRAQYLDPLLNGPLGRIAKSDGDTRNVINALFPQNPLPNSAQEVETAVRALAARRPNLARELVSAHARMVFNEAAQSLATGGNNQFGGAKFAAVIAGNQQQAANLEAAIRALPNGDQVFPGFQNFLETMEATGQRQRPGSATAFNQQIQRDLRAGGNIAEAGTLIAGAGLQWPKKIKDAAERWRLGRNVEEIATLFMNPEAGRILAQLSRVQTGSAQAAVLAGRLIAITQAERAGAHTSQPVRNR